MPVPVVQRSSPGAPAPKAGAAPVVNLGGLSVSVQRTPVLRGLDLTVDAGEAVGVVGPNGSGKSTLLRVLATLLPPSAGVARVLDAELGTPAAEAVRPRIALVGHIAALYPRLTLRENLHFFCRLTGRSPGSADQALGTVGLARAADRPAERCSHGMLRRAELARVLVSAPDLLLLDEAHAGLDPASGALVDVVVEEVRARGGGAVVVSHEHDRLARTADRIVEIRDGALHPVVAPLHTAGQVLQ